MRTEYFEKEDFGALDYKKTFITTDYDPITGEAKRVVGNIWTAFFGDQGIPLTTTSTRYIDEDADGIYEEFSQVTLYSTNGIESENAPFPEDEFIQLFDYDPSLASLV